MITLSFSYHAGAMMVQDLRAVAHLRGTLLLGAVSAAIDLAVLLDPMADNPAITMGTGRRHCVNSALKAVEGHRAAILGDTEGLIVIVAAMITFSHFRLPRCKWSRNKMKKSPDI